MKGSIFEIALELIKMAKTSVWYFFRNVSSISNSTQHFNEFLVSMARRRHRHKSLYSFFCFAVFSAKFCTKSNKSKQSRVFFTSVENLSKSVKIGRKSCQIAAHHWSKSAVVYRRSTWCAVMALNPKNSKAEIRQCLFSE